MPRRSNRTATRQRNPVGEDLADRSGQHDNRAQGGSERQSVTSPSGDSQFLTPDPPRPRPVLYLVSGALLVGWMIFLLVVALRG